MPEPVVEVIRELQATPAAIVTPVQETLVLGPAYHLRDYATDKANIQIGAYGSLTDPSDGVSNGRPLPGTPEIVSDPPDNELGALLDQASVVVYLDNAYVEIDTDVDGTKGTVAPDENLFFVGDVGHDFAALGVRPGDRLVVTDVSFAGGTVIKTIAEVGGYAGSALNSYELKVYSNFIEAELTAPENGSYAYRIEKVLSDVVLDSAHYDFSGQQITIRGGATVDFDVDEDNFLETVPLNYAEVYLEYRTLRQDLALVNTIESETDIETLVGPVDERNPLAVALKVAFSNTSTSLKFWGVTGDDLNGGSDSSTAHQAAIDAIETRKDVYALVPLTQELTIINNYKTSVLALAAPKVAIFRMVLASAKELPLDQALTNDSTTGDAEFVAGDDSNVFVVDNATFSANGVAQGDFIHSVDGVSEEVYTVNRVFDDERILQNEDNPSGPAVISGRHFMLLRNNGVGQLKGGAIADHGLVDIINPGGGDQVRVKDTNTLDPSRVGQAVFLDKDPADTYSGYFVILATNNGTLSSNSLGDIDFAARAFGPDGDGITLEFVDPGVQGLSVGVVGTAITVTLEDVGGGPISTAQDIIDAIEADPAANSLISVSTVSPANVQAVGGPTATAGGVYAWYDVIGPVALPGVADSTYGGKVRTTLYSVIIPTDYTARPPYRRLLDNSATFITGINPVVVGDNLEIPIPPGAANNDYDGPTTLIPVAQVLSDNRLLFANTEDIPIENNTAIITEDVEHYRVSRVLDKSGQVTALGAIAASLGTEHVSLMWPPEVLLEDVVNTNTGVASWQPGYYLAAGLGGMIANNPSQQGFSRFSISGIKALRWSNDYFNRASLETISDSGYFVFVQDNPDAFPTIFHQLTTDPSALETGELSMVRNYHFVAQTYKAALDDFLGKYNAIPETLGTIRTTMNTVGATLKRARVPRIGAPVLAVDLVDVILLEGSKDSVEVIIAPTFPAPLNRVILRIRG